MASLLQIAAVGSDDATYASLLCTRSDALPRYRFFNVAKTTQYVNVFLPKLYMLPTTNRMNRIAMR